MASEAMFEFWSNAELFEALRSDVVRLAVFDQAVFELLANKQFSRAV